MFARYMIGGLAAALVAAGGWGWYQFDQAEDLRHRLWVAAADLRTCAARIDNIQEDIESDAKISDPALFDVPSSWMLRDVE